MAELGKGWRTGAAGAMLALCLLACDREYESPYLPGSGEYAGDEWTRDEDGDGVADSVAKYAPECDKEPGVCIADAKVVSRMESDYRVAFEDMILRQGTLDHLPRVTWTPEEASARGFRLRSSDTAKVRIRGGRMDAVGVGDALITASLNGESRTLSFLVRVAGSGGREVLGITAGDLSAVAGSMAIPEIAWNPPDADHKEYTLGVDPPSVARAEGGALMALAAGTARITVAALDGGHKAAFTLTVTPRDTAIRVDSVRARDLSLTVGSEIAPLLTWYPEEAGNRGYSLVSSDPAVASVKGRLVRGENGGNTTVTVTADDGGMTATFRVEVVSPHIPVQRIEAEDMDMVAGEVESPVLSWFPAEASDPGIAFESDNAAVARIVDTGKVEALAAGTARVIVRSKDGPADTLQVTVAARPVPVTGIAVAALVHNVGDPDRDVAGLIQWTPADATDKTFKLVSSSNTAALALVDNNLRAVAPGVSQVVIESQDAGRTRNTFTVTVRQPVMGLAARDTAVWPGSPDIEPSRLITWIPANADNKGFVLASLDTAVASVFGDDRVRPRASGTARIVVKSLENALRLDTFLVTVMIPVKSLSVRDTTVFAGMKQIDPFPLATWNPANATEKQWYLLWAGTPAAGVVDSVTWRFNAVGPGKVNLIFVWSQNAAVRDTFAVTVIQPVTGLSAGPISMKVGDPDATPVLTWAPQNASDKGYTLTGGAAGIATAAAGKVHAAGPGTATFTARSNDGGKVATFTVTVTQPVLSIAAANLRLAKGAADMDPVITWNPANASNKGYVLSGGNASVAVVAGTKVRPVGAGTATFMVTTADGARTASFTATVTVPVAGVGCEDASFRLSGFDAELVITWSPSDATNKGYTLESSDPSVVFVSDGNQVTPVRRGEAMITVTSDDGQKEGSCWVEVR